MDQPDNETSGSGGIDDAARKAAESAQRLKDEAAKTVRELEVEKGVKNFFDFDTLYFPAFARSLFRVIFVFAIFTGVAGIVSALASMVRDGIMAGILNLFLVICSMITVIVISRISIELSLIAFTINEGVQEIRDLLRSKISISAADDRSKNIKEDVTHA